MPSGRPRKPDPSIPAHIDQARIPAGVYWDRTGNGRWTVRDIGENGKSKSRTIAGREALLSDLHTIAESRTGVDRSTLQGLFIAFHASPEFKQLATATRSDYENCRDRILERRTKLGGTFGELITRRISRPIVQRLIDVLATGRKRDKDGNLVRTPSTAAHALRYLRVAFRWGANRGLSNEVNPADGIEAPDERKQRRLPTHETFQAILRYARTNGSQQRMQGSVAPYLAPAAEIAYLCRLRGVEVVCDLNDADVTDAGLRCRRRKGSLPNITLWDDRLRAAYAALVDRRAAIWAKRKMPTQMRPEARPIVVSTGGDPLTKSAFKSAWQRMIVGAIAAGVIPADARFSMHDLKRRGVTDTTGTRGQKQQASGHRSEAMMDIYDQDVPVVDSAATSLLKKPKQA